MSKKSWRKILAFRQRKTRQRETRKLITETLEARMLLDGSGDSVYTPSYMADNDSWVYSLHSSRNSNYGDSGTLEVYSSSKQTYLSFDLTELQAEVQEATLKLHPLSVSNSNVTHYLKEVSGDNWDESTLTWNNKPASGSTLETWTPVTNQPVTIDLTDHVVAAIAAGDTKLSFAISGSGASTVKYASSEHADFDLRPQLNLTTNEVNRNPIGVADSYDSINGGYTLQVGFESGLLKNDYDEDGLQFLNATSLDSSSTAGTVVLNGNGSFEYTAPQDFVGTDSFTYEVSDSIGASEPITVSIEVAQAIYPIYSPLDDSWVYSSYSSRNSNYGDSGALEVYSSSKLTYLRFDLSELQGDTYRAALELHPLSVSNANVTHYLREVSNDNWNEQTLTWNNKPTYGSTIETWRPVANQPITIDLTDHVVAALASGDRVLSFAISGSGASTVKYASQESADVSLRPRLNLTTTNANRNPIGVVESYDTINDGYTLQVDYQSGVLQNDYDEDGQQILTAVSLDDSATAGTVVLNVNGSFEYTAPESFVGTDTFTYRVSDSLSVSDPITVSLDVAQAINPSYLPAHDSWVYSQYSSRNVNYGNNTTLELYSSSKLTYLRFDLSELQGEVYGAELQLHPLSVSNTNVTHYLREVSNDSWDESTLTWNNKPTYGNSLQTWRPVAGQPVTIDLTAHVLAAIAAGDRELSFAISGSGASTVKYASSEYPEIALKPRLNLTTTNPNRNPIAVPESYDTINGGYKLVVDYESGVLQNDYDEDGQQVLTAVSLDDSATAGTVVFSDNGSFEYTASDDFVGTDSFTYSVSDSLGTSAPVSVSIEVAQAINPAYLPIADSWVNGYSSSRSTNYGDSTSLEVYSSSRVTYLRFDLSELQGTVYNAALQLHPLSVSNANVTHYLREVSSDSWNEETLTWNNKPTYGGSLQTWRPVAGQPITIDLTDHVLAALAAGDTKLSFAITGSGASTVKYASSEHPEIALKPRLNLTTTNVNRTPTAVADSYETINGGYTLQVDYQSGVLQNDYDDDGHQVLTTVNLDDTATAGTIVFNDNGSFEYTAPDNFVGTDSFAYSVSDSLSVSEPVIVSIEVVEAVEPSFLPNADSWVYSLSSSRNVNYGSSSELEVYSTSKLTYFRFDLSDLQAEVYEAVLQLHPLSVSNSNVTHYLREVTSDNWDESSLTWNNRPTYGSALQSWRPVAAQPVTLDLTEYVLAALAAGDQKISFAISGSGASTVKYASSEHGEVAFRPRLDLTSTNMNRNPVGVADSYETINGGYTLDVDYRSGVLSNDGDEDGAQLLRATELNTSSTVGTVVLNENGAFEYTAPDSFVGTDSFTYRVSDSIGTSEPVTVSIAVAQAAASRVTADADSWVYSHYSSRNTNYGSNDNLEVYSTSKLTYLRFDLSELEGTAYGATLELHPLSATNSTSTHYLREVTNDNWDEATLTWNNKPAYGNTLTTWRPAANQPVTIDLTAYVLSALEAGDTRLSFAIVGSGSATVKYASSEHDDLFSRPTLTVLGAFEQDNVPPTISDIDDVTFEGYQSDVLPFTIGDTETAAEQLFVSFTSSNPEIVPDNADHIVITGTGAERGVQIYTPVGVVGESTITLTVTDAHGASATTSFLVANELPADTVAPSYLPVADAWGNNSAGSRDTSYGDSDSLEVYSSHKTTYFRFDLSELQASVLTAELQLHTLSVTNSNVIHYLREVSDDSWDESTLTWNNKPSYGDSIRTWTPTANQPVSIDLTDYVFAALARGDRELSFAITGSGSSTVKYASSEHAEFAQRPRIQLTTTDVNRIPIGNADSYDTINGGYKLAIDAQSGVLSNDYDEDGLQILTAIDVDTSATAGNVVFNATGAFEYTAPLDFVGTDSFTYSVTDAVGTSEPITVTLNVSQAIEPVYLPFDAWVDYTSGQQNTNHGSSNTLQVYSTGKQTFLGFDLSNLQGQVFEAKLQLHTLSLTNSSVTHFLREVSNDSWDESTLTWSNKPTYGDTVKTWTPSANQNSTIDLTEYVMAALAAGQKKLSFAITGSGSSTVQYASSEHANIALRPRLNLITADFNRVPVGVAESFDTINGGYKLEVGYLSGLLSNDYDEDGQQFLTATALDDSSTLGTVVVSENGAFEYTAPEDFVGTDTFTYRVSDSIGVSAPVTVSIHVVQSMNPSFLPYDAWVNYLSAQRNTNYGSSDTLEVYSTGKQTFLRFDLSDFQGQVYEAQLQLHALSLTNATVTHSLREVSNDS
ncbi:MAG: DNRLRE domain-containing protein, partial [Planctomycetota bacterium]